MAKDAIRQRNKNLFIIDSAVSNRKHIINLLYIKKSDRIALLTLLALIATVLTLLWLTGRNGMTPTDGDTAWNDTAASVPMEQKPATRGRADRNGSYDDRREQGYYAVETKAPERFTFDPNTADSTQLLRLGLQPWQVRNIYRYRARGGVYQQPSDFARLYGLTAKQYRELLPYIRIGSDYRPAAEVYGKSQITKNTPPSLGMGITGDAPDHGTAQDESPTVPAALK